MNKNFIFNLINMFALLSTAIFLFSGIFIAIFWGFDINLGVSYIFVVLSLSLVFSIFYIPIKLAENRNISKGIFMLINVLFFLMVNVTVVVTGFLLKWFVLDNVKMVIGFEATIIAVYVFVTLTNWVSARNIANKMNDKLREITGKQ